jgi:hypothetical protein
MPISDQRRCSILIRRFALQSRREMQSSANSKNVALATARGKFGNSSKWRLGFGDWFAAITAHVVMDRRWTLAYPHFHGSYL